MNPDETTQPVRKKPSWPRPRFGPQLLGTIGVIVGIVVYQAAIRLPAPWNALSIGLFFVLLGALVWWYARGEGWIRVLALVLAAYGLVRMFLR